ncbi:MAG: hypothetical protein LC704_00850 [Actinobacteria bacterium]|nr:hypothetical protein [Actinomycetota bacterium]
MNAESTRRLTAKVVELLDPYMPMVVLGERVTHPEGDPTDLEAGANRCAIS